MALTGLRTYQNSVAFITGGASGLGRALGEALASQGAEVVLADLQAVLAEEVAAGIRSRGGKATAVPLDVTDFAATCRVVEETSARCGRIDYFFNNAGIAIVGEAERYQIDDWNRVIDVNLRGVVNGVQAVYPIMRRQGFGHIVNTASVAGLLAVAGLVSYTTTKHAVVGLSRSLRLEAETHGVRVSALCPGPIDTPIATGGKYGKMLRDVPPDVRRQLWERERPMKPELFAREALRCVACNQAVIIIPSRWKVVWLINRLWPSLGLALSKRAFLAGRKFIDDHAPEGRAAANVTAPL